MALSTLYSINTNKKKSQLQKQGYSKDPLINIGLH